MSWGEIFFGFHGRINRKTYWLASILVAIAGLSFNALLSYLATGNPVAPEVWQRPPDKSAIWAPVWLAHFLFLAWPAAALAVKRLHDRGLPAWIWYVYYGGAIVLSFLPLVSPAPAVINEASEILTAALTVLGAYIFFELSVLRGVTGPNAYGADPLPADYYGGDYSFWSWMLAFEGRISRLSWWLGMLIVSGALFAASLAIGFAAAAFFERHPGLEQQLSNPAWVSSKEAMPILFKLGLWTIVPSLFIVLSLWSIVALSVKRLHDRGLSTWLILVLILPFLAAVASPAIAEQFGLGEAVVRLSLLLLSASAIWSVLQFGILKGETGPNGHGPDPLAGRD
jgi:uncharacterized membrane protein YhaH (DUF805 family)